MKIAYCIHSLAGPGGMERVLTLKANYLADRLDYDVTIITADMKGKKPFYALSEKVHHADMGISDNFPPFMPIYKKRLFAYLKELRPNITVSLCKNELFILPDSKDGSIKMAEYHFSHEKFFAKYGGNAIGNIYARYRTRKLEKAAAKMKAFVVLTKQDEAEWKKVLGNVHQIYNPLTFESSETADTSVKKAIAAGRLVPQKNYKDLTEAWKIVAEKHPDWTLEIFGEGKLHTDLQAQIDHNGLSEKVLLRGNSDDIRHEMLNHSFLVMSSLYEGFPMVLLEASECGLPMVSYNCPMGPSELIDDGLNGYLTPVGDISALAEAICKMIENPHRASFGAASKAKARDFRMDVIMEKWDKLFKSL